MSRSLSSSTRTPRCPPSAHPRTRARGATRWPPACVLAAQQHLTLDRLSCASDRFSPACRDTGLGTSSDTKVCPTASSRSTRTCARRPRYQCAITASGSIRSRTRPPAAARRPARILRSDSRAPPRVARTPDPSSTITSTTKFTSLPGTTTVLHDLAAVQPRGQPLGAAGELLELLPRGAPRRGHAVDQLAVQLHDELELVARQQRRVGLGQGSSHTRLPVICS